MNAETAISIALGATLAVFSFVLVMYSFVRSRSPRPTALENVPMVTDDLALREIFDAIGTLELEYQLGRVPQEEFQAQFQAYRVQAATVLREHLETGQGDPEWVLEQEILLARDAMQGTNEKTVLCPDCSAPSPEGADSCPHCGAEMAPQL